MPAFAEANLLLESEISAALTAGTPETAIDAIERELAAADTPELRDALLARLAELQGAAGLYAEAAATWTDLAKTRTAELGPRAQEVATAWEKAGDLLDLSGDKTAAYSAYVAAIRVDVLAGAKLDGHPLNARLDALTADLNQRHKSTLEAERTALRTLQAAKGPKAAKNGDEGYSLVRIYYATNRARTRSIRPTEIYGYDRGPMDYGIAEVSIPKKHRAGALEAPSIFTLDVVENPDRHLILTSVQPLAKPDVLADMQLQLKKTGSNEAFVFVHGFNVSFADAARRTAQMAYDMNFDGLPILFSWPSQGSVLGYMADGAVVQLSGRYLSDFLEDVVKRTGARRIHLIAHSMGNRALTEALELYALRHSGEKPAFDQVLFTAPDVDAGLFAKMMETISPAAERLTLYTSKNDFALKVSNSINGGAPRAGEGSEGVFIPPFVDSIDMSVLGEDMLAHSYFADDVSALSDILTLFWRDAPPNRRCGLAPSPDGQTSAEWSLEPPLCDGPAVFAALRLLRGEHIQNLEAALARVENAFKGADPARVAAVEVAIRRLFTR
jgi:esterase/lipase superfamily enzyme